MNLYVRVVMNHWDLYRFIENLIMLHLSYHGIIRLDKTLKKKKFKTNQFSGHHRPPPSQVFCTQAASCRLLPFCGMKFWTLFQNKFVFNRTCVSIVVIARCLSGLSWLFSPQVWKSMELLSLISWTATRGCSIGGMYYQFMYPCLCSLPINVYLWHGLCM